MLRVSAFAAAMLISASAFAQDQPSMPCGAPATVLGALQSKYQEVPIWAGKSETGIGWLVTQAPDGKTWTAMLVKPDGSLCLFDAGSDGVFPKPGQVSLDKEH